MRHLSKSIEESIFTQAHIGDSFFDEKNWVEHFVYDLLEELIKTQHNPIKINAFKKENMITSYLFSADFTQHIAYYSYVCMKKRVKPGDMMNAFGKVLKKQHLYRSRLSIDLGRGAITDKEGQMQITFNGTDRAESSTDDLVLIYISISYARYGNVASHEQPRDKGEVIKRISSRIDTLL